LYFPFKYERNYAKSGIVVVLKCLKLYVSLGLRHDDPMLGSTSLIKQLLVGAETIELSIFI
jgi:hypothetical protein